MSKPVLQVIICSTRPTRVGKAVGDWFIEAARAHGQLEVEVSDLAEIDLPLLDEPHHPFQRKYQHEHTKAWSERIDSSDAVVFVTPEYNYGIPATGKNALDYLYHEWSNKPVGFVSYGGSSGGVRAVQMFKQVATTVGLHPIGATVAVAFVGEKVRDGAFIATEDEREAATAVLDELARTAPVLAQLRD